MLFISVSGGIIKIIVDNIVHFSVLWIIVDNVVHFSVWWTLSFPATEVPCPPLLPTSTLGQSERTKKPKDKINLVKSTTENSLRPT